MIYEPNGFLPQLGLHQLLKQDLGVPIFHLQACYIQFGPHEARGYFRLIYSTETIIDTECRRK